MVAGSIPMKNSRNGREGLSSVHPPSVFLVRREKERHLARLHTPRSRGGLTGRPPPTPGRTHPGVESIVLWRIVSIGCCPKVSPKSVAARRTSLQTVELSPRCDATGCSEDLSITYFRISKRWDRFLANLLGETLVQ